MGFPVLIIGKSGSGKSTSLRNFGEDEIGLINVTRKQLPFKKKFASTLLSDNYDQIKKAISNTEKKSIIIDDAGYLIVNQFMKGHVSHNKGNAIFAFYNDIADSFWGLIEAAKDLPDEKIVYFIMHEDKNDYGDIKPKTIGKLLDDKVCIEGLFTICLRSFKDDNGFFFKTQTDGFDVSKTPFGMFKNTSVPNDLKKIDEIIREFYEI